MNNYDITGPIAKALRDVTGQRIRNSTLSMNPAFGLNHVVETVAVDNRH